jgi:4,4'-diaponeurosporenoate glycosyltransferase
VAEDLALAARFGRRELFTGAPDTTFRMYPSGVRSLLEGWTKNIATGAASIRWWSAPLTVGWIWSLAGGWLSSPWFYAASALQLWWMLRVAGRFRVAAVLIHPVLTLCFLAVFLRSVAATLCRSEVSWKGRSLRAR